MKKIFEDENVRLVNKNGEKHGTIIPYFPGAGNFEVFYVIISMKNCLRIILRLVRIITAVKNYNFIVLVVLWQVSDRK